MSPRTATSPEPEAAAPIPARKRLLPETLVQFVPGVGPARAALLGKLDIVTVEDLLRHAPRSYLDARDVVPIAKLVPGHTVTVVGTIVASDVRRARGRQDLRVRVADASGSAGVTWFGQGFLGRVLAVGKTVAISGELAAGAGRAFVNPIFDVLDEEAAEAAAAGAKGRIVPRHPLTAGISARMMRAWVRAAFDAVGPEALAAIDTLPKALAARLGMPPLGAALRALHFPDDVEAAERARRRLAFDELLLVQLVLAARRRARLTSSAGLVTSRGVARARAVIAALPFEPTTAQKRAVNEIVRDMKSPHSMHRLLVGDVGSGKTVVALLAAACAAEAGFQVAVMAPTEILAEQHFRTLTALGEAAGLAPALWTGSTPAGERRELARRLRLPAGDRAALDLVVGTHALLEDDVPLPRLGLVVVDEQHRFGVRQRAQLANKGSGFPDVLVMTATPIPRSLALTFLGDLEVSVLDELPRSRIPITTKLADETKRERVYEFLAREMDEGRQVYVVYPLIEESEKSELRAARAMVERLKAHPALGRFRWGLLHGRLKPSEKEQAMAAFGAGEIQGLVSTTVIEVGVDVPNASVMMIEHAERFGLTQLHQLRGRVGRGSARSYCVLMAGPRVSAEAHDRLALLARVDDGFALAEEDLRARGAGELWGTRQTGLPTLRVADLVRDADLVSHAHREAVSLLDVDPALLADEHRALRERLLRAYGEELSWRATG